MTVSVLKLTITSDLELKLLSTSNEYQQVDQCFKVTELLFYEFKSLSFQKFVGHVHKPDFK